METVSKKFGEMTFSDYNSAADSDFSLSSEGETEDSLEWASETERTRAEDDLMENKVNEPLISLSFYPLFLDFNLLFRWESTTLVLPSISLLNRLRASDLSRYSH